MAILTFKNLKRRTELHILSETDTGSAEVIMKVMATIIITTMIEEEQPFFIIIIRHQCLFVQSFIFDLVTTKNLFILLLFIYQRLAC